MNCNKNRPQSKVQYSLLIKAMNRGEIPSLGKSTFQINGHDAVVNARFVQTLGSYRN